MIEPGPTGPGFVSLLADDRTATPPAQSPLRVPPGAAVSLRRRGRRAALHRQRDERRAGRRHEARWRAPRPYVKDAFHRQVIDGEDATNPAQLGTKSCVHYRYVVPARGSVTLRMRLTPEVLDAPLRDVDEVLRQRRAEADEFYATIHPPAASDDERLVQRQAFAGLLWTKQIYLFDVNQWLEGDAVHRPLPESRRFVRNSQWRHLNSMRILSMPDKWEFPWFAGLGSGLSRLAAGPGRSRVCQGAAVAAPLRAVPASLGTDPGLRVGVLGRQPTRPRLGGLARLQPRPRSAPDGPTGSFSRSASTSSSSTSPGG